MSDLRLSAEQLSLCKELDGICKKVYFGHKLLIKEYKRRRELLEILGYIDKDGNVK